VQEEHREERALLRTTELELAALVPRLDRPEDPKLQSSASRPGTLPPATSL
jgi:hypothetical protein